MKEWFAGLNPRERLMVITGGVVLAVLLCYAAIWEPITQGAQRMETAVNEQRVLLQWMQHAADDVKRLRPAAQAQGQLAAGQSLLGVIDQTSKSTNLGPAVKRVKPEGENKVSVWMEDAAFDDMVRWVEGLHRGFGVEVDSIVIDRKNVAGKVDVRIELVGSPHG